MSSLVGCAGGRSTVGMSNGQSHRKRPGPKPELFPQIDATPEELMRSLVQTPPKEADDWRYMGRAAARRRSPRVSLSRFSSTRWQHWRTVWAVFQPPSSQSTGGS